MYVHHEYVQKDLDAFLMFPVGAVVGVVVFGWIFFILALIGLVADALWGEVGALTIPILGVPLIVIATILLVRRKP